MKKLWILFLLTVMADGLFGQTTVAVGDFINNSDSFFLDSWEHAVPEFLKSELSESSGIVLVERRQLQSVLEEQALSMTGLVDSVTAQKVGKLLGAQFIITGSVNKIGEWIRIDARIVRVANGQSRSEKVRSKNDKYLNQMMEVLGNNIRFVLAGEGDYVKKREIGKWPTTYFAIGTGGLTLAAVLAHGAFQKKRDEYRQVSALDKFDGSYDDANKLYKTRNFLASLAAGALIGTIYCWIRNLSPQEVLVLNNEKVSSFYPTLVVDENGKVNAGVAFHF